MKQFQIDDLMAGIPPEKQSAYEGIVASPDCKFLAQCMNEWALRLSLEMREALVAGKYDEARMREGYMRALEDVATLIESGLEQALTKESP